MKRLICLMLTLLFCLVLIGCEREETPDASADWLDFSGMDLSAAKSAELHCGMNGERLHVTDGDSLASLAEAVSKLRAEAPISARGHYGWNYGISFYKSEEPADGEAPVLSFNTVKDGETWRIYYGYYETVSGNDYPALYTVCTVEDNEACEKLDAICAELMAE